MAIIDRGSNQSSVRQYNERLVLSLIRREGAVSKADLARSTGLSAQTITIIIAQLEKDGLVCRQPPTRGKVGQPSVPYALNPEGAYSLGLKVGRRSFDLILIDFLGHVVRSVRETYAYPTPERMLAFLDRGIDVLTADLAPETLARLCGIGVAMPFELWNWGEETGAPADKMEAWRNIDVVQEVGKRCDWPVFLCNDATAACAAELIFGNPQHHTDFLYIYVGAFIGGGVALGGMLFMGTHGNAGAIGSMLVPGREGKAARQLLAIASLTGLEKKLIAGGHPADMLWKTPDYWGDLGALLERWVEEAAAGIAFAVLNAVSVMDFPVIIIDGAVPVSVRRALTAAVQAHIDGLEHAGLSHVALIEGTIGGHARALGGASLPLIANYARDSDVLLKQIA
ncbi:MAG: ROK family transcriptional regulator [Alphaproteobacteria bacterium]|nr:MAG: ROK family transcriptional regulator [Alphaproteobacteria bacterium]